jgi:hypothetical protein
MLGYLMMILVAVFSILILHRLLKRRERSNQLQFGKSRVMDLLATSTIIIFIACAVLLAFDSGRHGASNTNWAATRVVVPWTTFSAIVMLAYRFFSKKPIPV